MVNEPVPSVVSWARGCSPDKPPRFSETRTSIPLTGLSPRTTTPPTVAPTSTYPGAGTHPSEPTARSVSADLRTALLNVQALDIDTIADRLLESTSWEWAAKRC